jgi:hypothetical protein
MRRMHPVRPLIRTGHKKRVVVGSSEPENETIFFLTDGTSRFCGVQASTVFYRGTLVLEIQCSAR